MHGKMGEIERSEIFFGYPLCCSEFFHKHWHKDGWRDLILPTVNFKPRQVAGPDFVQHPALRTWELERFFICPVPLIATRLVDSGTSILQCAADAEFSQEVDWIIEMLNWPVRWSSLHGVAMITTPVVKLIMFLDPLPEVAVV